MADRLAAIDGLHFDDPRAYARELLARDLHWELERLDPSEDGDDWLTLKPFQRTLYRSAIARLFLDRDKVLQALGLNLAHNNLVHGCAQERKQPD